MERKRPRDAFLLALLSGKQAATSHTDEVEEREDEPGHAAPPAIIQAVLLARTLKGGGP